MAIRATEQKDGLDSKSGDSSVTSNPVPAFLQLPPQGVPCADANAAMKNGRTALDMTKRHPEIADLLRKHGGKTGEELKAEGK